MSRVVLIGGAPVRVVAPAEPGSSATRAGLMPAIEVIRARLAYNPDTGVITRTSTGSAAARQRTDGHLVLTVEGRLMLASHAVFAIMTGQWLDDSHEIEHADGDRANIRWSNLQAVPRKLGAGLVPRNSASGIKGVRAAYGGTRWAARGSHGSRDVNLGEFLDKNEAAAAVAAFNRDPGAWLAARDAARASKVAECEAARISDAKAKAAARRAAMINKNTAMASGLIKKAERYEARAQADLASAAKARSEAERLLQRVQLLGGEAGLVRDGAQQAGTQQVGAQGTQEVQQ